MILRLKVQSDCAKRKRGVSSQLEANVSATVPHNNEWEMKYGLTAPLILKPSPSTKSTF